METVSVKEIKCPECYGSCFSIAEKWKPDCGFCKNKGTILHVDTEGGYYSMQEQLYKFKKENLKYKM